MQTKIWIKSPEKEVRNIQDRHTKCPSSYEKMNFIFVYIKKPIFSADDFTQLMGNLCV